MYIAFFFIDLLCSKKLLQSSNKIFLYFIVIAATWSIILLWLLHLVDWFSDGLIFQYEFEFYLSFEDSSTKVC